MINSYIDRILLRQLAKKGFSRYSKICNKMVYRMSSYRINSNSSSLNSLNSG